MLTEEIDRLDKLAGETISRRDQPATPAKTAADPGALAGRILARYENLLAASGSTCELHCDANGELRFDTVGFERILINLIDNARKYAPGVIQVFLRESDGFLALSVRDFGADPAHAAQSPSHGLGLAIVRDLARANGGGFTLSGADPGLVAKATLRAEKKGEGA